MLFFIEYFIISGPENLIAAFSFAASRADVVYFIFRRFALETVRYACYTGIAFPK